MAMVIRVLLYHSTVIEAYFTTDKNQRLALRWTAQIQTDQAWFNIRESHQTFNIRAISESQCLVRHVFKQYFEANGRANRNVTFHQNPVTRG